MQFDFTKLPPADRYRLLTNFIGPRPIALVTTRSPGGHDNAAPMSFFNVFAHEPPIVIIGFSARPNGSEKDTLTNIRRTKEFCVNMVDMELAEQMILCGVNFNSDVDELEFAGLVAAPCRKIDAARIATTPCAMETRVEQIIDYPGRAIVMGRVLEMHVRDDCLDAAGRYVDPAAYQPIARLHADNYIVSDRQFELKKPAHLEPLEVGHVQPAHMETR
ncbi:flavin reductase family protein [Ruegeria marina]|uniref:NADH-FMN oxidoreductase RutF, flavin reductase (DIM6/NTAB) family n=1 Tax=Ruegeria marina TaxID=639004 RepID=A0A1G7DIA0_9RHOB|nr:flavin reductase family protein [Ruegeria marina]SDE51277.1 NADH-FMN oxidoreductase RutF, flavin reductase (DIM6/NTAB) family [Ruegeria marina]